MSWTSPLCLTPLCSCALPLPLPPAWDESQVPSHWSLQQDSRIWQNTSACQSSLGVWGDSVLCQGWGTAVARSRFIVRHYEDQKETSAPSQLDRGQWWQLRVIVCNCMHKETNMLRKMIKMISTDVLLLLLLIIVQVKGPIIKPYGQWLCNYCSMGEH